MNKILVKLNYSYADEFDVNSLWMTTVEEYEEFLNELKELKDNISEYREIYFGTNEYIYFDSYEEIIDSLTTTLVSDDFYNEFIKIIGGEYGLISISSLLVDFKYD